MFKNKLLFTKITIILILFVGGAIVAFNQIYDNLQAKDPNLKYEQLSPFEIKNNLIEMAQKSGPNILNAGRGNPNFLNTTARKAFSQLNLFASTYAVGKMNNQDLGLRPVKLDITKKLKKFLQEKKGEEGIAYLSQAVAYIEKNIEGDFDQNIWELVDATLGDYYPTPPKMIPVNQKITQKYLDKVFFPNNTKPQADFDLFATEGAGAAMCYTFKSLRENKLLNPGDHIAILTPIFSPYLEIPNLNDYKLIIIDVEGSEELGWQIPDTELKKLEDKRVKALFLVNPTNPTSVGLSQETIQRIGNLVRTKRSNLIVLTDTVYATFIDEFNSLVREIPENTITVYSYSKYFGVTGVRLGVVMLNQENIMDKLIAQLPAKDQKEINKRYEIVSITPEKIKFMDRIVLDSRDVALGHTAGISGPQQSMMSLFSIFELIDDRQVYKKAIQAILDKRINNLYNSMGYVDVGIKPLQGANKTHYYALLDLMKIAKAKYSPEFAQYLDKNFIAIDFLFKLAQEKQVICLPGKGFKGPDWSIRVSLANLNDDDYIVIGRSIREVMDSFYQAWQKKGL